MGEREQLNAFLNLLVAAMKDAAGERKLTQLLTTMGGVPGKPVQKIRIIIVPETMDHEFGKPLEHKHGNGI